MKGKIYKNRLSSSSNPNDSQAINNESVLHSQFYQQANSPKTSFNPFPSYLPQQNFMRKQRNQKNQRLHKSPEKTIINNLFNDTNYEKMHQSRNGISLHQKPSIIDKFAGLTDSLGPSTSTQINKRLLKRVVSNPDMISGQNFIKEKDEQNNEIGENSFLNQTTNSRSMLSPNKLKSRTPFRGNESFGPGDNYRTLNKNISYIPAQISSNFYNPLAQTSNFYVQNEQTLGMRVPLPSDYIISYQKRHKQRVSALQNQHELQIQFLEQELKSKDDLIQELKKMLTDKEQIIKKLQSQNANLSSRSYASFANGNSSRQ